MPKTRTLPTAARLVAAISLAVLGWFASDLVRPLMPPHTAFGWFNYVNAVLGALCGWVVIGSRAGRGYTDALANGLTGVLALIVWAFFAQSLNLMLKQAMENKYDGPMQAIIGIFTNAVGYAQFLVDPTLIAALLIGGMICGLLAEATSRRWS
jgi:hypothetical protein